MKRHSRAIYALSAVAVLLVGVIGWSGRAALRDNREAAHREIREEGEQSGATPATSALPSGPTLSTAVRSRDTSGASLSVGDLVSVTDSSMTLKTRGTSRAVPHGIEWDHKLVKILVPKSTNVAKTVLGSPANIKTGNNVKVVGGSSSRSEPYRVTAAKQFFISEPDVGVDRSSSTRRGPSRAAEPGPRRDNNAYDEFGIWGAAGIIGSVTEAGFIVVSPEGKQATVDIAPDPQMTFLKPVALAELTVGKETIVSGTPQPDGDFLASWVRQENNCPSAIPW